MKSTDEAGYYLGPSDNITFLVELMNESEERRPAVVTVTYEYISSVPQQWAHVTPIWLDIGTCSNSELPAKNNSAFEYSMQPAWKANLTGHVTWIAGHLHDGGTHIEVLRNNNTVCDCVAAYGQTPGYVETMSDGMNMSMPGMDMVHMSSITTCDNAGLVKVGDEWSVKAFYNTSEHAPMLDSGDTLAPIMGISLMYVANGTTNASGNSTTATSSTTTASATSSGAAAVATMPVVQGLLAGFMAALFM